MKSVSKSLATLALAATALVGLQAQAVVITFGGQVATGTTGQTSSFVDASNLPTATTLGYVIETFDAATADPRFPAGATSFPGQNANGLNTTAPYIGIVQNQGCAINSFNSGVAITAVDGTFTVRSGSVGGVAAAPGGDAVNTSCFGFGPGPSQGNINNTSDSSLSRVKIDYTAFLAATPTVKIDYLGLLYGSIDDYNDLVFYDGANVIQTVTGLSLLNLTQGCKTGDQTAACSNLYVNLAFGLTEQFTSFEFVTRGVAFEVDNIVAGLSNRNVVPEPGSMALIGLGLVGMAAVRRRKQAK